MTQMIKLIEIASPRNNGSLCVRFSAFTCDLKEHSTPFSPRRVIRTRMSSFCCKIPQY